MSLEPDQKSEFYPVKVTRNDRAGLIFLSCEDVPDFFATLLAEEDIRPCLDQLLKTAFADKGRKREVYTNGKIDGPTIDTVVRIRH